MLGETISIDILYWVFLYCNGTLQFQVRELVGACKNVYNCCIFSKSWTFLWMSCVDEVQKYFSFFVFYIRFDRWSVWGKAPSFYLLWLTFYTLWLGWRVGKLTFILHFLVTTSLLFIFFAVFDNVTFEKFTIHMHIIINTV